MDGMDLSQTTTTTRAPLAVLKRIFFCIFELYLYRFSRSGSVQHLLPPAGSCVQDKSWRNSIFRQRRKIKVFAGTRVPAFTREKIMLNCQPPIKSVRLTYNYKLKLGNLKVLYMLSLYFFGHSSSNFTVRNIEAKAGPSHQILMQPQSILTYQI